MTTHITAGDLIAAFQRRGVPFRFFKDRDDFVTHNRNHAGANQSATPGGFGPIRGVIAHNFGSGGDDADQLAYLYRGDGKHSEKPGPLCLGGIVDDGTVVLMGWGTATHSGPGDPKAERLLRTDAMPLDRERPPTTNGKSAGTVPINPFYLAFEMCHGAGGPTAAQRRSLVLATAAIMEMLGGPREGYSGGSLAMHRELTTNREDPQGVARDGSLRREVNAVLRSWATAAAPLAAPRPTNCTVTLSASRILAHERVTVTANVVPAVPGVLRFEFTKPGDADGWKAFGGDVAVVNGRGSVVSTPGSDIVYRARFTPTNTTAHAVDWSPNVSIDVVTLADVIALEQQLTG